MLVEGIFVLKVVLIVRIEEEGVETELDEIKLVLFLMSSVVVVVVVFVVLILVDVIVEDVDDGEELKLSVDSNGIEK